MIRDSGIKRYPVAKLEHHWKEDMAISGIEGSRARKGGAEVAVDLKADGENGVSVGGGIGRRYVYMVRANGVVVLQDEGHEIPAAATPKTKERKAIWGFLYGM
jgi:hypothetical protein